MIVIFFRLRSIRQCHIDIMSLKGREEGYLNLTELFCVTLVWKYSKFNKVI